jgi:hypothetical protein
MVLLFLLQLLLARTLLMLVPALQQLLLLVVWVLQLLPVLMLQDSRQC